MSEQIDLDLAEHFEKEALPVDENGEYVYPEIDPDEEYEFFNGK